MAGFIFQDELLRFDGGRTNNGRLKAVGGFRPHHNDGSDGEHQQGVQQFPTVIRSLQSLHLRGQKIDVCLGRIHSIPPECWLKILVVVWTSSGSCSEHRVHERGWQSSLASPILS